MEEYQTLVRRFKALNHPVRLAILDLLRDGERCVYSLEAALGYRQAYISQQLMVLRDAGLVTDRREGWNVYYQTADHQLYKVIDAVAALSGNPAQRDEDDRGIYGNETDTLG
jgi:DNA-binding transcriptional ArsR family regulator